jgi:hypothetical protein
MKISLKTILLFFTCASSASFAADTAYLFTSFRGSGDGLHLAYSKDGLEWVDLSRTFLTLAVGSKLLRDPQILFGPDGLYHMVWTSGWKDSGIGYATSKNLTDWSEQKYIPLMENTPGTQFSWAPELFYDEETKNYIIMWSSNVSSPGSKEEYIRAYYSLTQDFKTFTEPKILFDPGFNNIDTTMLNRVLKNSFKILKRKLSGSVEEGCAETNSSK